MSHIQNRYPIFRDPTFETMLKALADSAYKMGASQKPESFIHAAVQKIIPVLEQAPEGSEARRLLEGIQAADNEEIDLDEDAGLKFEETPDPEDDVANEIRKRLPALRDPSFDKMVAAETQAIYRVWDRSGRTSDGLAKFVERGLTGFLSQLREKSRRNADLRNLLDVILQGAERPERPDRTPIPITERNVALELEDRFPMLSQPSHQKMARLLARDIHREWLKRDPQRERERRGRGLRGLIPESVLESGIREFYEKLEKANLRPMAQELRQDDRGLRTKRGTDILEYDIANNYSQ